MWMGRPRSVGSKRVRPKPGDLVRVIATDDVLIKVGSYGVIGGLFGASPRLLDVTFNYYTPYCDDKGVSASGGPVRGIKASNLKTTGEKKSHPFWRFEHDIPGAGRGVTTERTVNVFEVDLHNSWK